MPIHPRPVSSPSPPSRRGPPGKRRAACAACRARRSKCDLIDHLGCHRCKQLKTACSLAGAQSSPTPEELVNRETGTIVDSRDRPPVTVYPSHVGPGQDSSAVLRRLAVLESELEALKSRGSEMTPLNRFDYSLQNSNDNISPLTSLPTDGQRRPSASQGEGRVEERDETWYRRWADPEAFGLVHRGLKSKRELGLRDPIADGIITEAQAEAAYQLFKYNFSKVFPHPHLLQIRSSYPSQPFHLSACLYYVAHCPAPLPLFTSSQIALLKSYLTQNLDAYYRGCRPSLEGVMAAVVLSFLPSGSNVDSVDLDPARMIGLAYAQLREMGHSVFIDRLLSLLESGVPIKELEHQLHDARVFMSVINRSAWFAHSRCPWASLPVLIEGAQLKILAHLKDNSADCELDQHLMFEQDCLNILFRHSRTWQDLQRIISPSSFEVVRGNQLVRQCGNDLDALLVRVRSAESLRSRDYLACHVTYCQWWVSVRNVWSIYRLPVPLLADHTYAAWLEAMTIAAEYSVRMLSACLGENWKLDYWPSGLGRAVLLCFVALSTSIIYCQHIDPTSSLPGILDIAPLLESIKSVINQSPTELASLMAGVHDRLAEYKSQLENVRAFAAAPDQGLWAPGGSNPDPTGDTTVDMADFFTLWNGDAGNVEMGEMFGGIANLWSWPMGNGGGDDASWRV